MKNTMNTTKKEVKVGLIGVGLNTYWNQFGQVGRPFLGASLPIDGLPKNDKRTYVRLTGNRD